jgi:hypothetical protein
MMPPRRNGAYHLIQFSREALRGEQNASFYSARERVPMAYALEVVPALRGQPLATH